MMFFLGGGYYYKTKKLYRVFAAIYNMYIALKRYDGIEHIDSGEHVGFWSTIQLCISNLGGTCLSVITLVFTYESAEILEKILWVVNEVVRLFLVDSRDIRVICSWWGVVFKIWMIF